MDKNVATMYQQANVLTANPLKLVLMCYEGAISNLELAKEAYMRKEYEAKAKALQKALDIICELDSSLSMEKGGEIAVNLRRLYLFMTKTLVEADVKKDMHTFDRIIDMLKELESAWIGIGSSVTAMPVQHTDDFKTQHIGIPPVSPPKSASMARAWSA